MLKHRLKSFLSFILFSGLCALIGGLCPATVKAEIGNRASETVSNIATGRPPNTASGSVTFSEVRAQQGRWHCDSGPGAYDLECYSYRRASGSFMIAGTLSLEGFAPADFNENTPVSVRVGNFEFLAKLGDDINYVQGATSARFEMEDFLGNFNQRYLTVRLDWHSRRLQVMISGMSVVTPYWNALPVDAATPILANTFIAQPTGTVKTNAPAALGFGGAQAAFGIPSTARVRTSKDVSFDYNTGFFTESFVRLKGRGAGAVGE